MDRPFQALAFSNGPPKPRHTGITAVIDTGLGLHAIEDLTQLAAAWIDVVKIGWGLSCVHPRPVLEQKLAYYRAAGIVPCTGGTLLEIAVAQGVVGAVLDDARALGFEMIEVSNGVHPMSQTEKLALIETVLAAGFRVVSEVGRKSPEEDARIPLEERIELVESELAAGSEKVILEARASGTVGIFDKAGEPAVELLDRMVRRVGVDAVIFEAPRKSQQLWLIQRFGRHVNLGNIPAHEALPLASLRTGLRGDTFPDMHLPGIPVFLELGVNGAFRARGRGGVVLLVDALRASATIVTALGVGMRSVRPVAVAGECVGEVTAGERGGKKLAHLDHANSPTELVDQPYAGKQLALTTSNGVECLLTAAGPETQVIVATTLNASAAGTYAVQLAARLQTPITIVMAGRNHREAIEDELAAAELVRCMGHGVRVQGVPPRGADSLEAAFFRSASGKNLVELGYAEDVRFCAQVDVYDVVPVLVDGLIIARGSS